MNYQLKYGSIPLALLAALWFNPTLADEFVFESIKIVESSDPEFDAEFRAQWENSDENRNQRDRDRTRAWHERTAMKNSGYIITDQQTAGLHQWLVSHESLVDQANVEPMLGFQPAAFHLGLPVVGVYHDEPTIKGGQLHDIITILDHPTLGKIRVSERSFSTEPKGRLARYIHGPKFDLNVNGNPALLTVYVTTDGVSGRTDLSVMTRTKLVTVGVGVALLKTDPRYEVVTDIASRL